MPHLSSLCHAANRGMVQPDEFRSKLKSLPRGSFTFFLLVVGVLLALVLWSLISSPRLRMLAKGEDARTQLQTELRSLAGFEPLSNRKPVPQEPQYVSMRERLTAWKWPLLILVLGGAFAAWALVNFVLVHTEDLDDEEGESAGRPAVTEAAAPSAARKAVPAQPDWMRMAVQRSREGLIVVDSAGRVQSADPAAEKLCGAEAGRLPGRRFVDFVPEIGATDVELRRFSQVASATELSIRPLAARGKSPAQVTPEMFPTSMRIWRWEDAGSRLSRSGC
ncbi:MAG: PAS domain-containing protein, partial [Acidobacteria bacterium]|nr:PAS domain-containing protein [Acidobacteriota bacterium]